MNYITVTKSYSEPDICKNEILRYSGCKSDDAHISELIDSCLEELKGKLSYKVCYCEVPVHISDCVSDLGCIKLYSKKLAQNLDNCKSAVIFAATIGVEIDRLIAKYGRISPSKALIFQAIGAERIEALCDALCADIETQKGVSLKPRFGPGYGDLALERQKDICSILECSKKIGVSLNDSLLMSPSKSVTAIIGITDNKVIKKYNKCNYCDNADCPFRRI